MSAATSVVLVAVLGAVFFGVVAVLLWQEARRRGQPEARVYGLEEATMFVSSRIDRDAYQRLGIDGVRRILEWEVYYLQGLAEGRRKSVDVVAGGHPASVAYIVEQIAVTHHLSYSADDVSKVLAQEAAYLASIGAVGEPVEEGL